MFQAQEEVLGLKRSSFKCASGSWTLHWVLTYLLQETSFNSALTWLQSWRHLDLLYSIMAEKCFPAPTGERQGFRVGTGNCNINSGVAEGLWRSVVTDSCMDVLLKVQPAPEVFSNLTQPMAQPVLPVLFMAVSLALM